MVKLLKVVDGDEMDNLSEQGCQEIAANDPCLPEPAEKMESHKFLVMVVGHIDEPIDVTYHLRSLAAAHRKATRLAEQYRDRGIALIYEERGYWEAPKGKGSARFRRFDAIG